MTKENMENGNVHFRYNEFTSNFEGGALQGVYLDEYNYMKIAHFTANGKVVMELEGVDADNGHFTTIFVVMEMLNSHPAVQLRLAAYLDKTNIITQGLCEGLYQDHPLSHAPKTRG